MESISPVHRSNPGEQRKPGHGIHHFVFVVDKSLPRRADDLRLTMKATHPDARKGDTLLIGENEPDDTVDQDKGRLNALWDPGTPEQVWRTEEIRRRVIPTTKRRLVVFSQRLYGLQRGDSLYMRGKLRLTAPPRRARLSTRVILADDPGQTSPEIGGHADSLAPWRGEIAKSNGGNYKGRTKIKKVGLLPIRVDQEAPVFVNYIATGGDPFHTGGEFAVKGGHLRIARYKEDSDGG